MLGKFDLPPGRTPACFERRVWEEWRRSLSPVTVPCVDCNEQHQADMLKAGRCERPDAIFVGPEDVLLSNNVRWGKALSRMEHTAELESRMRAALGLGLPKKPRDAVIRWLGNPHPGIRAASPEGKEVAA